MFVYGQIKIGFGFHYREDLKALAFPTSNALMKAIVIESNGLLNLAKDLQI